MNVRNRDPVSGFHIFTDLSYEPDAKSPVLLKSTGLNPDVDHLFSKIKIWSLLRIHYLHKKRISSDYNLSFFLFRL